LIKRRILLSAFAILAIIIILMRLIQFPNKTLFIDGENRTLKFKHQFSTSEILDEYQDNFTNSYYFIHKTGALEGFIIISFPKATKALKKLDEAQIKAKADGFVEKYINIAKYSKVDTDYIEGLQYYQFTYTKMIQNYKTTDGVGVTVTSNGIIEKYGAQNVGIFNKIKMPKINNEMITSAINNYINKRYGNIKYSIDSKILDIDENGKIVIKCQVVFNADSNGTGQGDSFNVDVVNGNVY